MQRFDYFNFFSSKKFISTIYIFLFLLSKVNSSSPEMANENQKKVMQSKRKSETILDAFSDNLAENIGIIFNATLFIFLLLSSYLLCALCKLRKEEEEVYKPQVYKFIYLTNNGYIVISLGLYIIIGNEKTPFFLYF